MPANDRARVLPATTIRRAGRLVFVYRVASQQFHLRAWCPGRYQLGIQTSPNPLPPHYTTPSYTGPTGTTGLPQGHIAALGCLRSHPGRAGVPPTAALGRPLSQTSGHVTGGPPWSSDFRLRPAASRSRSSRVVTPTARSGSRRRFGLCTDSTERGLAAALQEFATRGHRGRDAVVLSARGMLERPFPARLGSGFRWLVASSWAANLGDGFALAAGPLLVASQTHDPSLVALALLLQRLPWLLFGLLSGALADRVDMAKLAATVELTRAVVLVVLVLAILSGSVSIAVVLAALFVLGTAEVFSGTASSSMLPFLVSRDDLILANSRILTGVVTLNQLVGPALGALLFAAGTALPFAGQAVLVGLGAVMVTRTARPARPPVAVAARLGAEVLAGCRWAARHAGVRTLVLTIFIFNITFGAAWSVLVLYAEERLHLGAVGFGILTTASAVGGVAGNLGYGWLIRRVSLGNIMRVGLIIETLTHLSLALTTSPAVAVGIMVVFGAHAFVWGSTSVTVRQRAVPEALQGRVSSVNSLGVYGGLVIGAALGGLIASHFGVTGPFWFAFAGSGLFVVLMWRQLTHITHEDASAERR